MDHATTVDIEGNSGIQRRSTSSCSGAKDYGVLVLQLYLIDKRLIREIGVHGKTHSQEQCTPFHTPPNQ
ncbi:uncharacterized protein B0H18DRAFT_1024076 [Fomitopsis serialis]|uniref:uncharacterized protein n=1 Tax=Fomitopsis serialis TaxID=139415 RepID=UPI00200785F6|nr:uncharacterized protein B0H18DRAFT_1024076 [Neoantrodia serialis]KAH9920461.1 hypothetical protein B0H18DRAFT_1024076 [Neoantrodia serialis]